MEAQRNHRENMKNSKKYEGPKIRASTGDIIIFGGTIIAAAIGAAFVAHRGRSRNDNKGRDRRQHDDERGLQSLVHLGKKESSVDSLMENRGKEGLSIEFSGEGESDRGEDGSEGVGDSSTESSNEAVWPAEVIEQEEEIQSGLIKTENQQNEGDENLGMGIKSILPRIISNFRGDEEFGFHDSVEILETKYIVTVENPVQVNANVSNVVVNDFSFWSDKKNAPPGHTEQYIEESDIAHVTKNELLHEGEVEKEEISKTNETKQQLEISETTRDVFASKREKDMGVLENLLHSSICLEQRNWQVSIDKSDVTKEEEEDLNSKSQEVTEFHVEDVGERRAEDSEGSRNSLEIPSDRSACQEDTIEQEKADNSMLTNEVNDQFDIPRKVDDIDESAKGCTNDNNNPVRESLSNAVEFNMLDDETSEILEESKISHIEVDLVEEGEGGDQSSQIDGVENVEENGGDGIDHLNVETEEGDDISNMEVVVVEEDVNGGDGVVIEVENEARGDSIANIEIEEEQQQKGGDDITNIEEEEEEVGGDQSSHIGGVENEEENGGDGIAHLNVKAEEGDDISNMEEVVVKEDVNGGDGVVIEVDNEARGDSIANIEIEEEQQQKGGDDITNIEEEEEEVEGDQSTHVDGVENEEENGGDGIAHLNVEAEEGNDISNVEVEVVEEDENGGNGVVIEVDNEARGDRIADIEIAEEQQQKGGDDITNIEEEEEEVGEDQSSHIDGVENEEENGGDGMAHLNVGAEEGNDISNIEVEVVEDENGDGVVIEVGNEERGDSIANIKIEEEQQQKGGDDISYIEEEEEVVGGDQSSYIDGVENEEEKGGHEIANLNVEEKELNDITNIEVEKVEEDESGGDGVVIKVENEARDDNIANIQIEDQRQNGGADITNIVVVEKDENGEDGVAIEVDNKARVDDITHIEVEEEQPRNGGVDITHTKILFKGEVREDDIARTEVEATKELKDSEEDKKENEGEGIAHVEDKVADVDEAKEEKGGDASTHVEVAEEQKEGDNIAYTKLEELADEAEAEEEKGNCNANIEMEEEIGDDSRPKETEVAVEEKVKEEEKEGDDTTHTEVQKEEEEERGEGEQESSSLKSWEIEMKSPVEEENEMQESITENTSMEFDGKEVWTAEEGKLEKHSVPIHEMNTDLENPEMIDQMVGMPPAERDENTNEGIQSFLHHNDRNVEVVVGMSVAIQEKDHINLDLETESQNTGNSFEMAIEKDEGKAVANTDHGNVMKECPYSVEISNFSQYENEQDLQEPDASHVVEEEDKSSIEAEIESYIEKDVESTKNESEETRIPSMQIVAEAISQTKASEEEKRLPFIENEMKLMSEIRKMTADEIKDIDQVKQSEQGNEPKATNKESEMTVPCEEKKMDFLLTGQSKGLFFFVLALALALGLLALAHHGQLHDNHHRLHKIYYQLYQFFFPSVDGPLDEF